MRVAAAIRFSTAEIRKKESKQIAAQSVMLLRRLTERAVGNAGGDSEGKGIGRE